MRRRIKPNHRTGIPSSHVVFDCETTPVAHPTNPDITVHRMHLVVARSFRWHDGKISRVRELATSDRNIFWSWLFQQCSSRKCLWAWAHNLAFDLTALRVWELIASGELSLSSSRSIPSPDGQSKPIAKRWHGLLVSGDPPTILSVRSPEGFSIKMLDTMNWCPTSLAAIGSMLGLDKLPRPGELSDDATWLEYCRRDVAITTRCVEAILGFVRKYDLGNLRTTVSAQAYALWRHRCLDCRVDTHDDLPRKSTERSAYYGCRRGNYFIGQVISHGAEGIREFYGVGVVHPWTACGPVHRLDLVGAYPSVMSSNWFPVKAVGSPPNLSPARLQSLMRNFCAVAIVRLYSPHEPYPVRTASGTYWKVGSFLTTLCGPELQRALTSGHVMEVDRAHLYTAGQPFDTFVREVWKIRQETSANGLRFEKHLAKAMAVGLHGKFGQRAFRWLVVPDKVAPVVWGVYYRRNKETKAIETYRSIGGTMQVQGDRGEMESSSPIIAAYTLAYHRERMRKARLDAGHKQVLYEDSDCLHVTQQGLDSLRDAGWIDEERMGAFRIVRTANYARYWGHKHYQLDDLVVRPGISVKAVKDPKGLWHQNDFQRLDQILNHEPPEGPICFERTIADPSGSVDGSVQWDGWVDPLHS
jgi:DNA polymerase type B, organellar and viral